MFHEITLIDVLVGSFLVGVAIMPNPPGSTHFGEGPFGKKLIPWAVVNALAATFGVLILSGIIQLP